MRALAGATALLAALAVVPSDAATPKAPRIGHLFVIELENKGFDTTFGASAPAYLARVLPSQGALLTQYYATGHASLDNYITQVSGQAANMYTQADCQQYVDVVPGVPVPDGSGQVLGQGCVYPASVQTLPDQLTAVGQTWHGYMEDLGADPAREKATCGNPGSSAGTGTADPTQSATAKDQYAARHNPFVYFHSLLDSGACDRNVGPLPRLASDLHKVSTTANFTWVTPDLCSDGHDAPCVDGRPGGLASINDFLQVWVPRITSSPAFKKDGLLVITFDEADVSGDATACCGNPTGPNTLRPGISGPGGGRTGAVLLSPYIKPGTRTDVPYDHYSALRSYEDLLGIRSGGTDGKGHLGYAARSELVTFGKDIFTR
jgi:phosphatidylinositol-3-phosphatase